MLLFSMLFSPRFQLRSSLRWSAGCRLRRG